MNTIFLNSPENGLGFSSFENEMIKICDNHKSEGKALAFAFILYDFENPHISKILADPDYWRALNQISGQYLSIFNLHYREPDNMDGMEKVANVISIDTNQNLTKSTNSLVKKYFGNIQPTYPSIIFFQVSYEHIIDSLLIELNEEKTESAFLELKEYIKEAVLALKAITAENKSNHQEIFDCIERRILSLKNTRKIKRITNDAGGILGLISSVKSLF